ncbi:MAG TPA: glycosyl hydrolase 53 family protein [Bacteroidota bacterium]|nr:glycosyl hydrolase 53 family protein [Bacteroidota bacterium]
MRRAKVSLSQIFVPTFIVILLSICVSSEARAQFANGADIGWLSQMEAQGYVFKDNSGIQRNCLDILKGKGINALRFRVWVNPQTVYCSKKDVAYMAHRADSAGFKVLIDFHCSDTWADPGHQTKPAAWANDTLPQLLSHLYDHIYGVLDTLKSIGVVPAWVQIGNETNDGMLWETGRASTHMSNFAQMIQTGYNAVKAVDSSIQVIVHLSNGHDDAMFRGMFDALKSNGAKWDIIGMSVYPYWAGLPWATDDSLALVTMKDMVSRYQTKVMVVEAGYLYNQPVAANQYLYDLIAKTKSAGGLGVFYWEPESYNWQGYQLGAWDPVSKEPTVALDAFLGINVTSVRENENIPRYDFEIYPNPFNPTTTVEYSLSSSARTSVVVYDLLGREIARLVDSVQNAGPHKVNWTATDVPSGVYCCRMRSGNFVETKEIVLLK